MSALSESDRNVAQLGLFAVADTQKALALGLNPVMAALLGMLTGISINSRSIAQVGRIDRQVKTATGRLALFQIKAFVPA